MPRPGSAEQLPAHESDDRPDGNCDKHRRDGVGECRDGDVALSCAFAAARQNRNIGAISPSLRPLSTFRRSRSRAGTRRSRMSAAAGAKSVGTTTVASTASIQNPVPGRRRNPTPSAASSVNGRAMPSSRAVSLGSRPKMPPGVSVASTNSKIARTTSTVCSKLDVSRSIAKDRIGPGGQCDSRHDHGERRRDAPAGESSRHQRPRQQNGHDHDKREHGLPPGVR